MRVDVLILSVAFVAQVEPPEFGRKKAWRTSVSTLGSAVQRENFTSYAIYKHQLHKYFLTITP